MIDIKAVLFDFGGTLDSNGLHWRERFSVIYREAGIDTSNDAFVRAFYDSDDNLPNRFDLKFLDLEQTVRLQVGCVLDSLHVSQNKFLSKITSRFVEESRSALSENRPILERLARDYRLGIVSNFYGNLESILKAEGLLSLFGAVADSHIVGVTKPDADLFLFATNKLGVDPSAALMVGDSLSRDMRGAENLAMPHAWMAGPRPPEEVCCSDAVILGSLGDIEQALRPLGRAA